MHYRIACAIILPVAAAAGCATTTPSHPAQSNPVQSHAEATASVSVAARPSQSHEDVFQTSVSPLNAGHAIADVYKEFGFVAVASGGGGGFNGFPAARGDYFSARIGAGTANGEEMEAACVWKRDGETEVRFQSSLPATQHEAVLKRIRAALAK